MGDFVLDITVNGEKRTLERPVTVAGYLEGLGIDPETVVIELNLQILSREDHGTVPLRAGDTLEIIRMVDGG